MLEVALFNNQVKRGPKKEPLVILRVKLYNLVWYSVFHVGTLRLGVMVGHG